MKKRVLAAAIAAMCFVGTVPFSVVPIVGVAENVQEQTVLTENNDAIYGIGISKAPDKTTYKIGEQLNLTGLRLNGSYRMGELISTIIDEDYQDLLNSNVPIKIDASEFDNTKAGRYHIYVIYGNTKNSFTVTVYDDAITTTITVTETKPVTTITMPVLDDPTIQTEVVTVTVMSVNGDDILVKPVDGSPELKSSNKFSLSANKFPDDIKPKAGMKLEITYNGGILETYPAQFGNVQKIVAVKDDTLKNDGILLKGTKDMTLNDVMRLAEKGDELDWSDFKDYKGRDVGSGLHIWEYKLEDGYVLDVGGDIQKKPIYILLSHDNDKGIDIRTNDVKEYIASSVMPVSEISKNSALQEFADDINKFLIANSIAGSAYVIKNDGVDKLLITYDGHLDKIKAYIAKKGIDESLVTYEQPHDDISNVLYHKGDANCDGQVDLSDAVMIMQALANPNKYGIDGTAEHHLTEQGRLNADVDGDGLTVGDAQDIQLKLLGIVDSKTNSDLKDVVSIRTPYDPIMSNWSGIGILLEFDSSDYQITLFAEDGHFTYWDINKGSGPIKDVGTTYEVGKNGYIFWTPDDLKYPDDYETEIIVKGTSSNKSVELGRIYITGGERSTLIASLEKPDSAIDPMQPEIQPLGVGGIDEAITLISNCDLNNYDKVYHDSYKKMFERFKNDGFIYQVTENETIKVNNNRGVALFPYARYEDIGVGYYVTFKEKNYHIMFYYADTEVLTETDGIAEYLKKRMGRSSDKIVKIQDKDVSLLFPENGQCYANAFIDENHYFDVIGAVSKDELIEFLNAFEYGKLNLKSDKRLKLIDSTIKSVNVTSLPKGYDFTFTDSKAQKFIDFLSDMELTDDFSEDPGQLNGMTWVIKLEYQNNETMTLYDIGGYIRSENDSWLKYEYDYDSPLNTLIWELSK